MTKQAQEIRIGAIYVFAAKRRLPRIEIEGLLRSRAHQTADTARLLAGHWVTTDFYRNGYRFTA